jgi:ABC-type Fe3+/spermidine/putrescine transport system ATPase subunit
VRLANQVELALPIPADVPTGAAVHVAIRPERARLTREAPGDGLALPGTVRRVLYLGAAREIHLDLAGGERGVVEVRNDGNGGGFAEGSQAWLSASLADCRVLPVR